MKEAARTSILSKTWRYSWTYLEDLDFDTEKCLGQENMDVTRSAYVRWVNRVIKAHRAPLVKKFRIFFYLDAIHARDIDSWIRFCSRKGVQELELDCGGDVGNPGKYYNLESMWQLYQRLDTCKTPIFTNLRSFHVDSLKVSGALVELMLSKCPLLETLCLKWCQGFGSLNVVGSSLKLKHLELRNFKPVKVVISAPNLLAIVYWGSNGDLVSKYVPSLVEAQLGGMCAKDMIDQLCCWSSQLETLSITESMDGFGPIHFPCFSNLKRLVLSLRSPPEQSILMWSHLIDASPSLLELKLELYWWGNTSSWEAKATNKMHHCLEDVHVVGFRGCNTDIEFVAYLVKIAPSLKSFTIDTRCPLAYSSDKYGILTKERARRQCSKQCAEQFAWQQFPPTLDVVIT